MNKIHLPLYSLMGLFITSEITASEDNDKKNVTHQVSQISTTDKKEPTEYKDNRIDRPVPKDSWDINTKKDPDYYKNLNEKSTKYNYRVETEPERKWKYTNNMLESFNEVNGSGGLNEQGSGQPSPCCVM